MSEKILVTGGTGLVGSYLLDYLLQRGHTNIVAIKRPNSPMELVSDIQARIQWIDADILNMGQLEDAFEGVGKVYHSAALVSFDPADKKKLNEINIEGTANIVNLCLELDIKKLCYVSSVAALGRPKEGKKIDEDTPWDPEGFNTHYAISKHTAEMEVWRGMAEGINAVIVNPATIIGAGYWTSGPQQLFQLAWKNFKYVSAGQTSFVDVRDVVKAMYTVMEGDYCNDRYLLAAENLTFEKLFNDIHKVLDKSSKLKVLSPFLLEVLWRLEKVRSFITRKKPLITKETVKMSQHSYEYVSDKSLTIEAFAYTPIEKSIAETGKKFLQSVKNGLPPKRLKF